MSHAFCHLILQKGHEAQINEVTWFRSHAHRRAGPEFRAASVILKPLLFLSYEGTLLRSCGFLPPNLGRAARDEL